MIIDTYVSYIHSYSYVAINYVTETLHLATHPILRTHNLQHLEKKYFKFSHQCKDSSNFRSIPYSQTN